MDRKRVFLLAALLVTLFIGLKVMAQSTGFISGATAVSLSATCTPDATSTPSNTQQSVTVGGTVLQIRIVSATGQESYYPVTMANSQLINAVQGLAAIKTAVQGTVVPTITPPAKPVGSTFVNTPVF